MILSKWNYKKHTYEPYEVSDKWNCKLYSEEMEETVNCPHCGKEIRYGDSYTSLEIHNDMGFGFAVCEKCYEKEWLRRREGDEEIVNK